MISITKRKTVEGFHNIPSPIKKVKVWNDEDDGGLDATQLDFMDDLGATQVDSMFGQAEEKEELPSFKLSAFGDEEVIHFVKEKEISCQWSEEPLCIGRIKFLNMPDEHKNRISRKHFEIHCCTNEDTDAKQFWLVDCSANGTMVDGEIGYAGKKTLLEDGSAIGLLLSIEKDRILFGYSFSIPKGTPKKAPKEQKIVKSKKNIGKFIAEPKPAAKASGRATITATTTTAAKGKVNGVKTNGVNGGQKTIGKEIKKQVEQENEEGRERGVFAIPAPKVPLSARPKTQGFMNGVRFALIGYSEAALLDPKKKKLIKDLCDRGATYVLHPEPTNVDVVVLNRNYFKEPANYDVNLQLLTSSLRVRFTSKTRWMEDCVRVGRKLELCDEILAPNSGGVIVLDIAKGDVEAKKGNSAHGIEPRIASQLASMLRSEKKCAVAAKWKVIAPLATIGSCSGVLEGLEVTVEGMKNIKKGDKGGERERGEYMLGLRETHAVGYRHVLWLVSGRERKSVEVVGGMEKVVSVVDGSGLVEFAKTLAAQREDCIGKK